MSNRAFFPITISIYARIRESYRHLCPITHLTHLRCLICKENTPCHYGKGCLLVWTNTVPPYDEGFGYTSNGGAEGSRTPVRKHFDRTFSGRRTVSAFPPWAGTGQTAQFSRVMMHGRGNSYPPHVRHINDAFPGLWPLRFRRLPLVRQRQQYDCCQLILKLPVLRRSGAAARLSCLHAPVETGTAPYMG